MGDYREILTDNEVVQGYAYPIEVKVVDGADDQKVPSAATITVKDPDGTAQVEDQDMSIDESGTMTYSLAATYTADLWEDAIIEIEYTISSVDYKRIFLFHVVLSKLKHSVSDSFLQKYHPQLDDELWDGETTYTTQIDRAFNDVKQDIYNRGRRPHMLLDGSQIDHLVALKSFELIFADFSKGEDDRWGFLLRHYMEKYKDEFQKLRIKYDADEDGIIEKDEREFQQLEFKR